MSGRHILFTIDKRKKQNYKNTIRHLMRIGDVERYTNKNIDVDKVSDNVILRDEFNWEHGVNEENSLENYYLKEKNMKLREDATYTANVVINIPKELNLSKEQCVEFFKESISFLEENTNSKICTAVAHFDEVNPHLHVVALPMIERSDVKPYSQKEMKKVMRDLGVSYDFKSDEFKELRTHYNKTITSNSLNFEKAFVDGKYKLEELQDKFYKFACSSSVMKDKKLSRRINPEGTKYVKDIEKAKKFLDGVSVDKYVMEIPSRDENGGLSPEACNKLFEELKKHDELLQEYKNKTALNELAMVQLNSKNKTINEFKEGLKNANERVEFLENIVETSENLEQSFEFLKDNEDYVGEAGSVSDFIKGMSGDFKKIRPLYDELIGEYGVLRENYNNLAVEWNGVIDDVNKHKKELSSLKTECDDLKKLKNDLVQTNEDLKSKISASEKVFSDYKLNGENKIDNYLIAYKNDGLKTVDSDIEKYYKLKREKVDKEFEDFLDEKRKSIDVDELKKEFIEDLFLEKTEEISNDMYEYTLASLNMKNDENRCELRKFMSAIGKTSSFYGLSRMGYSIDVGYEFSIDTIMPDLTSMLKSYILFGYVDDRDVENIENYLNKSFEEVKEKDVLKPFRENDYDVDY